MVKKGSRGGRGHRDAQGGEKDKTHHIHLFLKAAKIKAGTEEVGVQAGLSRLVQVGGCDVLHILFL